MLLPPTVKIHFATQLVDMRNGIDGLRQLVVAALKKEVACLVFRTTDQATGSDSGGSP